MIPMIDKTIFAQYVHKAARALGANSMFSNNDSEVVDWMDNENPPTDEAVNAKIAELKAEYDAQEYARNRKAEYPDWGSQLEKIDDDGLTRWREEMIDPIKSKWPKDNSGPKCQEPETMLTTHPFQVYWSMMMDCSSPMRMFLRTI